MDDSLEGILQVDAFRQAVCCDQNLGFVSCTLLKVGHAFSPFVTRELSRDDVDGDVLEGGAQVLSNVVGGGDEAAEQDWREARLQELLDLRGDEREFGVRLRIRSQLQGAPTHCTQGALLTGRRRIVLDERSRRGVSRIEGVIFDLVQNLRCTQCIRTCFVMGFDAGGAR